MNQHPMLENVKYSYEDAIEYFQFFYGSDAGPVQWVVDEGSNYWIDANVGEMVDAEETEMPEDAVVFTKPIWEE